MRNLEEGAQLAGRYTLIRRLGVGGMAESWLASDRLSETSIVLKFARQGAGEANAGALLKREWQTGSRLMHANIVRTFEYHDDPDGAYFGLQYVGETDIGVTARGEPADSLRPLAMIADALRYAHGKGIVHRDIKAANVLLDRRGVPYLIDFGVAAPAGSDRMGTSGSPVAQSPDQAAGEPATPADDIYALGVLLHELLAGHPPAASGQVHIGGAVVPDAVHELLSEMLAPDSRSRPDAESVARRLENAGFPPGPAPARYVGGAVTGAEVVASVDVAATRLSGGKLEPAPRVRSGDIKGIPPGLLYGGLGVALTLLLVVLFVLPMLVDREATETATGPLGADPELPPPETMTEETLREPEPGRTTAPSDASFSENVMDQVGLKAETDIALGDLLSQLERLRYRAIERWGGQPYLDAVDVYAGGDDAYVDKNYRLAGEKYREASRMLEPFFGRIDEVFEETLAAAKAAMEAGDPSESVRLFDLAASITPGNRDAEAGLARARNLASVLSLVDQGEQFEKNLEYDAARRAFESALDLDAAWAPAAAGLDRVRAAVLDLTFEQRMTEGFDALADGDFATARAAFNSARGLKPDSSQPVDGLLQVDQEARLFEIRRLEDEARSLDAAEQWETAAVTYQDILKIDPDLQFAQEGLRQARVRSALHARLQGLIDDPDSLADDVTMQNATKLLLDITRIDPQGPRLSDQKNELSRLLKRAATPLRVQLLSDNMTNVSIYKVGRFGNFATRELELRPGTYVAVGIRPGYRDVRIEFRVAPEVEMRPIVVQCEEAI
jgi:tetratricopeptide (TPR) repeat protein